jgi:hypothetical protein
MQVLYQLSYTPQNFSLGSGDHLIENCLTEKRASSQHPEMTLTQMVSSRKRAFEIQLSQQFRILRSCPMKCPAALVFGIDFIRRFDKLSLSSINLNINASYKTRL